MATATYSARDLKDIAAQFDRRGDYLEARQKDALTLAARAVNESGVRIWREAADILRNTTLDRGD